MPDLSSITLPNNVTYNFKDEEARNHQNIIFLYADITWVTGSYGQFDILNGDDVVVGPSDIGNMIEVDHNFPILLANDPNDDGIILYPTWNDGTDLYFICPVDGAGYYRVESSEGAGCVINYFSTKELPIRPSSNYAGKVLMLNSSGKPEWSSLPIYNGGVS